MAKKKTSTPTPEAESGPAPETYAQAKAALDAEYRALPPADTPEELANRRAEYNARWKSLKTKYV